MYRAGRAIAAWGLVITVGAGFVVAAITSLRACMAHGYALVPPSANAWALMGLAVRDWTSLVLLSVLCIVLPAWWANEDRARLRWVGRIWAVLAVGLIWAYVGLQYNRYQIADLWRESATIGGRTVPRAILEVDAWAVNGLVTLIALAVAWLLARMLGRFLPRLRLRTVPRVVLLIVVGQGLLLLLGAARPLSFGRPWPAHGDVILISLDAVRADRLGCFGNPRGLTPNLDRLAEESHLFSRAYAQEPWTLTSHMSMLTGLYPDVHGLDFGRSLSPSIWTLPELLRDLGFRTAGSVYDCFLLEPRFGYGAGFDRYEVNGDPAEGRVRRAARWLRSAERPAFLFLHFYDAHSDTDVLPYEAGDGFLRRFAPGAERGFSEWTGPGGASETLRRVNEEGLALPDSLRARIPLLYDASVAEVDAALGVFFQELRNGGRYDDALIAIVADHGEALGEAQHYMHERLMEETLRIPLLIKFPRGQSRVRTELTETVDLLPTLLGALGRHPADSVQGVDLASAVERRFALHRSGLDYAITTDDGWRLLYRWSPETGVRPVALRRAGSAAGDGEDLLRQQPELADSWAGEIDQLHRANALLGARYRGDEVQMDASDQDLLRSLGYID